MIPLKDTDIPMLLLIYSGLFLLLLIIVILVVWLTNPFRGNNDIDFDEDEGDEE